MVPLKRIIHLGRVDEPDLDADRRQLDEAEEAGRELFEARRDSA